MVANTVNKWLGNPISRRFLRWIARREGSSSKLEKALKKYAGEDVELSFQEKFAYLLTKLFLEKGAESFGISKEDVKKAITTADIKKLISKGYIKKRQEKIKRPKEPRKRRKGPGRRKGAKGARLTKKRRWINTIRPLRRMLKELRDKGMIERSTYRKVYRLIKSGSFRSRAHLKLYLQQHGLLKVKE